MGEFSAVAGGDGGDRNKEEEKLFESPTTVIDFELLCSTVAMRTEGKWTKLGQDEEEDGDKDDFYGGGGGGGGGVLRMWEGGVLDLCDDRRIAAESFCCPCYRFGKNMSRSGFGSCFFQATVYYILALCALLNVVAFFVTNRHCFVYLAIGFAVLIGIYLGFFRTQIKEKFNIRGSESALDDCFYHLFCPLCALSQEARTLEMNNVQDGTWHGPGDTLCIGSNQSYLQLHPPAIVSTDDDSSRNPQKANDNC
ncbi:Protein PLANT CADMIUM RESISTANCE 10 [Linum perenne]